MPDISDVKSGLPIVSDQLRIVLTTETIYFLFMYLIIKVSVISTPRVLISKMLNSRVPLRVEVFESDFTGKVCM